MNSTTNLTVSITLLVAAAAAQTTPGVIGITSGTPLVVQQDPGSCVTRTCTPAGLTPRVLPFEGGAAYDATMGAVWVTTGGTTLMAVDPDTCRTVCPLGGPVPAPWRHITGLAINESDRALYVSDATNTIYTLDLSCPLRSFRSSCLAPAPAGHIIGGLAVSDMPRRLFYSTSDFSSPAAPGNMIHVAPLGSPCRRMCAFAVPTCGRISLGPITGLGFDACTSHLWITDGTTTMGVMLPTTGMPCTPRVTHCCTLGLGTEEFAGICFEPSHSEPYGGSCTAGSCATCPGLTHSTLGDPVLGNPDFALLLSDAPGASSAFLLLNFGTCTSGVPIPFFCGPLYLSMLTPPVTLAGMPTSGSSGSCGGGASSPLPIPLDPGLCGVTVCTQWLGLCGSGGSSGTWVSNAQGWTLGSS